MTNSHSTAKKIENGLTMIELLVVMSIVAVLAAISFVMVRNAEMRAHDAQRKQDLQKIKVAFEDYYNDKSCYPAADSLSQCGKNTLSPYLKSIPCDPQTRTAYIYAPMANRCEGYRVYTELEETNDDDIAKMNC